MTTITIDPNAVEKIKAAKHILKRGAFGDGVKAVCAMSAMVSGAQSIDDCVTAGWPEWLVDVIIVLFDARVGADDEGAAAYQFALGVADAVQVLRDYDKARDRFLIARLDTGKHSGLKSLARLKGDWWHPRVAVERAVELLHRRIAGEDVAYEMQTVAVAAANAAHACASRADCSTTYAASRAARAVTYAASNAVRAAANEVAYAAVSYADACAAAREDLIAALNAS